MDLKRRREQSIAAAVFAEILSVDEGKEVLRQLEENEQTRIFNWIAKA